MLSADDRRAIEALHDDWLNAELNGDAAAVLQFCTAAPVWLPPGEAPLCGRAAILDWLGKAPHVGVRRIEIDHMTIDGRGGIAWKHAAFRTTLEASAGAAESVISGAHGWVLRRDEDTGKWRVAVVTWTVATA